MIHRQMDILSSLGVQRFFVVVGHEANDVCAALDDRCMPIVNEQFAQTNSLYSLWLALKQVRGSFMLLNSDVLAHPEVYRRVATGEGASLAYDSSSGDEDEHMKVRFDRGRLQEISKSLPTHRTDGENVGILRFDGLAGAELFAAADAIIQTGDIKCWAPAAVDRLAQRVVVRGVDVADLPWTEIDFPEDLEVARNTVWPAIEKHSQSVSHDVCNSDSGDQGVGGAAFASRRKPDASNNTLNAPSYLPRRAVS